MTRLLLLSSVAFLGAVSVVVSAEPAKQGRSKAEIAAQSAKRAQPEAEADEPAKAKGERGRPAHPISGFREGEAEKKLEEALKKPTQLEFVDTPLQDVVDFLKNHHGIEIQLDKQALDQANVGTDTPITKNLKGISLRSALRLMLKELDLTYVIQDEVLLITTQENADSRLLTVVYEVADLVTFRDDKDRDWDDYETLTDMIATTVEPTTWDSVGGPGSIVGASFPGAKVIVVSQTQEIHEKIVDLLRKVRRTVRLNGASQVPPPRNPSESAAEYKKRLPVIVGLGKGPKGKAIEKVLGQPTDFQFVETPLRDVIGFIRAKHKIEVQLDKKALDQANVGTDTPITKNLKDVSLRTALRLILHELDLNYTIQDEVLLITTEEVAGSRLITVVYEVGDLVTCRDDKGRLWDDYDTLTDIIAISVYQPIYDNSPPGSIVGASFPGAKVVVVAQTEEIHEKIVDVLGKVRRTVRFSGANQEPPRRNPRESRESDTKEPSVKPGTDAASGSEKPDGKTGTTTRGGNDGAKSRVGKGGAFF